MQTYEKILKSIFVSICASSVRMCVVLGLLIIPYNNVQYKDKNKEMCHSM